jgi:hypothetical protein
MRKYINIAQSTKAQNPKSKLFSHILSTKYVRHMVEKELLG